MGFLDKIKGLMGNTVLKIDIPADIITALNESRKEIQNQMKLFTAIKYYSEQKLTIGKAARLAGLTRINFETELSKNNIPISFLETGDIESDIKKLHAV